MPAPIRVASYTYHVYSSRDEGDVVLYLYDEHSTLVAQLFFVPEGKALPSASKAEGRHTLYFRRRHLPEVLDLLRNEGPLYLTWDGGFGTNLSTEYEPIGAGELGESKGRKAGAAW